MPANYLQVLKIFESKPRIIQDYFENLPSLIRDYWWDISISYMFSKMESAKHSTLYCGIVKLHWTDASLTRELLDRDHISRSRFKELFRIVFGKPIDAAILGKLSAAEAIRDKVAHGKILTQAEARQSIADALEFAALFDEYVFGLATFHPFGDLRGFRGRKEGLSKSTTRWVLRGMGIPAIPPKDARSIDAG